MGCRMKDHKFHLIAYKWQPGNRREIEAALADSSRIIYENNPDIFRLKLGMENYDAIILGIDSDNINTFSMLRGIRRDTPSTPVIIASAVE